MAILKDEEEQKGQGTSQVLGQGMGQPQQQAAQQAQPQTPSSGPANIGGSSATQASAPVKAMPKQQKAGTGTFANLKSYLQAAQSGGQQKVAQAATQQVQGATTGAQKGIQQAQKTFGQRMDAASLANMGQAESDVGRIIGQARGVTYQTPQPAPALTQEQISAQNEARANLVNIPTVEKPKVEEQTTTPAQPQAPAQPQQYFSPEDQQRFAEIINAEYKGPQSLQQAGLYQEAARKSQIAQLAGERAKTASGREQLLRDIFGRGRDYSQGASKLDALLLNTSQQGVGQVQQAGKQAANISQALQQAQNLSANEAAARASDIEKIRTGARTAFTETRAAEEKAVEDRLSQVIENWDQLPNYFKEILKDREKGTLALSEQEAALLGIRSGEGLYNMSPEDIIKTTAAERERLITKDELSRQLALQQLAELDANKQLQKDLQFTDLEKAGTQTAADAINKQAIREALNAQEKAFSDLAGGMNITGKGMKKHSQTGKKFYADETANLKNVLEKAGYKFAPSELPTGADIAGASTGTLQTDDTGSFLGDVASPYTDNSSLFNKAYTGAADYVSLGGTALLRGMGIDIPGTITNAVEGIFGGGRKPDSYAKETAARIARQDLQKKIQAALEAQGFANRAIIGDTEQTRARQAALQDILSSQEKLRGK